MRRPHGTLVTDTAPCLAKGLIQWRMPLGRPCQDREVSGVAGWSDALAEETPRPRDLSSVAAAANRIGISHIQSDTHYAPAIH